MASDVLVAPLNNTHKWELESGMFIVVIHFEPLLSFTIMDPKPDPRPWTGSWQFGPARLDSSIELSK